MNVKARLTALRLIEKQESMPRHFERMGIEIKMITKDNKQNTEEKEECAVM